MTSLQGISPLDAALELERRGQLPDQFRSMLDQARQSGQIPTPGIDTPGMTVRGRTPASAPYSGPTFRIPGGAVSYPQQQALPSAPIRPTTEQAAGYPAHGQPTPRGPVSTAPAPTEPPRQYGNLGQQDQSLLTLQSATAPDYEVGQILAEERRKNLPFFRQMTFEQQVDFARNKAKLKQSTFTGLGADPRQEAQRAMALQEAHDRGEIVLPPEQHDQIRKAIAQSTEANRREALSRAVSQMSDVSAGIVQHGAAATFGVLPMVRNWTNPELAGMEEEIQAQHPISSMAGQLTGSFLPVAGAASLGGRLGARALGRFGAAGRGIGVVGGGFAAGELAQAPLAFGQSLGGGASVGEAFRSGAEAAGAIPLLAAKIPAILRGEAELTFEDRLNLASVLVEGLGIGHAWRAANLDAMSPTQRRGAILAEALQRQDIQLDPAIIEEAAYQAFRGTDGPDAGPPVSVSDLADDRPFTPTQGGPDLDEFGRLSRLEGFEQASESVAYTRDPNTGLEYGVYQMPDGSFQYLALDESGTGIGGGRTGTQAEAFSEISQPLPSTKANDLGPVQNAAGSLLKRNPTEIEWGSVTDDVLLQAREMADPNTPMGKAIEIQQKARGLEQAGGEAEIRYRMYEQQVKNAPPGSLAEIAKQMPDEVVAEMAFRKKGGPISKAMRAESMARGINFRDFKRPAPEFEQPRPKAPPDRTITTQRERLEEEGKLAKKKVPGPAPKASGMLGAAQTALGDLGKEGVYSVNDVVKYVKTMEGESAELVRAMLKKGDYVVAEVPIDQVDANVLQEGDISPEKMGNAKDFIEAGSPVPPIVTAQLGKRLTIADGTHRLLAAKEAGHTNIPAIVTRQYAELHDLPHTGRKEVPSGQETTQAPQAVSPEGPKPVQELTVREAREEAKRLGVPQYDNERGQPSLRKRIEEARAKTEEAPKEEPLETEPADTGSVPEPGPVPEESVQASSVEAPEDLRPAQEQARSLLQQDPLKIKWADVSDEALLTAYRESTLGSPIQKALEIQRKARGLEGVGFTESEIRTRMYGQRLRAAERSQIADVVKDIPDDTLGDLAKQFKQGPVSKAVRKEADARGIDYGKPPANPRSSGSGQAYAGAPATLQSAGARIRGRAKAVQSGKLRGSPQSPHRIIAETARKLGMGPVGTAGANALKRITLGFYRAVPEAIRLRFKDDMDVFMHELGHHLHKMVIQGGEADRRYTIRGGKRVPMRATGLDQDRFPAAWHKELDALGRAAYGSKKPAAGYMSEGWAELVRYAFTDQSTAYRLAPTAYTDMVRTLQTEFPEAYRALVNFRHRYQLYHANAPAVKLAGYIRTEGMPKGPMGDQLLDAYDKARIELFDKFQPLVRLKKDIGIDTDKLPADKDPHVLALRAGGRSYGHLQTILEEGRVDFDTGKVVPGKKSLLQIIEPAKDHLDEFDVYMAGKRAIEKRGQVDPKTGKFLHKGVFAGLDDSDLRQAVKDLEREYPHFKQMAQEFQELNEWFLSDYAVKAGLITAKQADTIISQNLHYITFKKVKIDEQLSPARTTSKSRKFSDVKSGIRRFAKFHGEQIDPPLESFIASMQSVINNAQINRMAESLVSLAEIDPTNPKRPGGVDAIGRWIDRIDRPMEMSEVVSDAVRAELEARLKRSGYQNLDPNTIDTILRLVDHDDFHMFRPGMRTDKGSRQIMVLRKGKPTLWEIKDQNLFDMMEGIGNVQSAHLLFRTVRNLYRAGATTLSPEFWLQNFLRDGFQAFVFSGGKLRPGTRAAAWLKAFTTGDPGAMFKASGASMSSLFGEYVNPRTKKIEIDRMFGKKNVIKQSIKQKRYTRAAKEVLSSPFDLIRNINDRFEMANRLAEFEVMLRDKPNPSRADIEGAGQAAADVTLDFQRGGRTSLRVNQYIPFFNAAFQGADKLAREIKKNPPRFFGRMFTYIIAPSLAVHLMNRRDEEYWQLTYQERDRYWHIPLGDPDFDGKKEWIKIPKPYGLGAFSVAVERALARYDGIDPVTGKRGDPEATEAGSLAKGLTDTFRPPYTVPLLTPTFELIANYSIFYGGPIVREAEKHGPIHERGAERSSELAYVLGKLLGVEPPRIDYAINGVFAGLGTDINKYIISPVVKAAREGLGGEVKPQRKIKDPLSPEQWFILNRFLMDEPREYTESNRRFWQTWDEMENTWNGYTSRKDNPARALKYMEDNRPEIMAYKNLLPYKNKMDILYRQLRRTYRSGEWPEKEMYDEQNRLFLEITKTAREAMQRLTTIKKETE